MKRPLRNAVTAVAALALVSGGALVARADDDPNSDQVDVSVHVDEVDQPGVLALTVAGTSTTLAEIDTPQTTRSFVGVLPTVTVTDTRSADEIAPGSAWYVLGTSTDFTGTGVSAIPGSRLGWTPRIIGDDGNGLVFAGEPVEGGEDPTDGIASAELLVSTIGSADIPADTSWTATADLDLTTEPDVAPGDYTAVITLSLFEDVP